MKRTSKLAVLLSMGALLATAVTAKTVEQAYLDSCRNDPTVPVPTMVIAPIVGPEHIGETVEVGFTVTKTGEPVKLSVAPAADTDLANAVVRAVSQWHFRPALRNGVPVETKVLLPVRVMPSGSKAGYAYNR